MTISREYIGRTEKLQNTNTQFLGRDSNQQVLALENRDTLEPAFREYFCTKGNRRAGALSHFYSPKNEGG
jgi:hypothetical protein